MLPIAMIEVSTEQAAGRIEELIERASAGEEVVMVRRGQPVARLVPYAPSPAPRVAGRCAGQIVIVGDFNAPLPDDILDTFEQ